MATPAEVAASVLAAVPNLTTLQRLRLRNQWAQAWDAYAAGRGLSGLGADAHLKAGWYVHHEVVRALREADWTTLAEQARARWEGNTERDPRAEQARARWEGNTERDPRAEIWRSSNRFVVSDTVRAVLARDTDIDPDVYALLTAAWRSQFPGFDA